MSESPFSCKPAKRASGRGCVVAFYFTVVWLLLVGVHEIRQESMLLPKANKAVAQAMCVAISNAIDQFQTEYDRLPLPVGAAPGQDCDCDTTAGAGILAILEGQHPEQNPRLLNFLGDIPEASVAKGKPRRGIYRENGKVALYDSWGHPCRVRLDLSGDGFVTDPHPDRAFGKRPVPSVRASGDGFVTDPHPDAPQQQIPRPALVWSAGEDGDFAT